MLWVYGIRQTVYTLNLDLFDCKMKHGMCRAYIDTGLYIVKGHLGATSVENILVYDACNGTYIKEFVTLATIPFMGQIERFHVIRGGNL